MIRLRWLSVSSLCGALLCSALLCSVLAGCGWHLQGSLHLPPGMATTIISTDDMYTDFYRELRRALMAAGVRVVTPAEPADAIVHVHTESFGERVAAQSARNTAAEMQAFYAVDYSVVIDNVQVLGLQHVELGTNYSYDATLALAKQREQRGIQEVLARELANQVVRRLASIKTQPRD